MKNYEKYADEIRGYKGDSFCADFVRPNILKSDHCESDCTKCRMLQAIWLLEDYKEPEVDWSKVEVDTPIMVRVNENKEWERRYFAKYKNGIVYAWNSGCTSWTTHRMTACMTPWIYAKLAEDEKEYKEPEVDWNKVEVDTPILVANFEDGKWRKRYFAKFEDGKVYAWVDGRTSWNSDNEVHGWKYAKLAEDEKECEEPKVDWSKVPVDTPILVKDYEDAEWSKRHFAKYENGIIYAWQAGCTSQSIAVHMSKWKFAKLAENEETK